MLLVLLVCLEVNHEVLLARFGSDLCRESFAWMLMVVRGVVGADAIVKKGVVVLWTLLDLAQLEMQRRRGWKKGWWILPLGDSQWSDIEVSWFTRSLAALYMKTIQQFRILKFKSGMYMLVYLLCMYSCLLSAWRFKNSDMCHVWELEDDGSCSHEDRDVACMVGGGVSAVSHFLFASSWNKQPKTSHITHHTYHTSAWDGHTYRPYFVTWSEAGCCRWQTMTFVPKTFMIEDLFKIGNQQSAISNQQSNGTNATCRCSVFTFLV